jgi:hypothetical protein
MNVLVSWLSLSPNIINMGAFKKKEIRTTGVCRSGRREMSPRQLKGVRSQEISYQNHP